MQIEIEQSKGMMFTDIPCGSIFKYKTAIYLKIPYRDVVEEDAIISTNAIVIGDYSPDVANGNSWMSDFYGTELVTPVKKITL